MAGVLDYWLSIILGTLSHSEPEKIEPLQDSGAFNAMVAEAAYYRANQRGFTLGYALCDWLEAENEILACLETHKGHAGTEAENHT